MGEVRYESFYTQDGGKPHEINVYETQNAVFTSNDWGKFEGIAVSPGLRPGGFVCIGGPYQNQLKQYIVGPSGAYVNLIYLQRALLYNLRISGAGPKGAGSGSLILEFTDRTNDTYKIELFLHETPWEHNLRFTSKNPVITTIRWYHSDSQVRPALNIGHQVG